MLLAAGILSIIAAGLYLLAGIISLYGFFQTLAQQSCPQTFQAQNCLPISLQDKELGILGALNLVSFGLGLTGGVLSLDRRNIMWVYRLFVFAIIGPIVPFGVSFATPSTSFFGGNLLVSFFVFFSLPAICLVAVSLIFAVLRRDDFLKS